MLLFLNTPLFLRNCLSVFSGLHPPNLAKAHRFGVPRPSNGALSVLEVVGYSMWVQMAGRSGGSVLVTTASPCLALNAY
jgi:hypothetical protein